MILRVKLIGSGVQGDSYRVQLPSYQLLHGNITQRWAIVSIPDDVHGLTVDDLAHEIVEQTTEGPHYPALCDDCVSKVYKNLGARYKEHKGEYALEIVKREG